ncbi:MAG: putative membrane protein YfcA [Burkholderiaceae bacterium]|jgi:uncharacterized membrane protein YfcA
MLSPLAPIGVRLGAWMDDRIDAKVFCRILYGFLLPTGLKLSWVEAELGWLAALAGLVTCRSAK